MSDGVGAVERRRGWTRVRRAVLGALVLLGALPWSAAGQALVADEATVAADDRMPVVFIHGACGSRETWTAAGGLAELMRLTPDLAARFAPYYFEYPSAPGALAPDLDCAEGGPAETPERVRALARGLQAALAGEPGIGPERQIALVAHSTGGLIARAFMQELGQAHRTRVLITLATPHRGIRGRGADQPAWAWDGADAAGEPGNAWLRALNGPDDGGGGKGGAPAGDVRAETLRRLIAIGLVRPSEQGADAPGDGLVAIRSALLAGAVVSGRYRGLGGQEGGSGCASHPSAHAAIVDAACLVEAEPRDGRGPEPVFAVVARALDGPGADGEAAPGLAEDLQFQPDLRVSSVTLGATVTQPGGQVQLSYALRNDGLVSAGASTTRAYLSADTVKNSGDKLLTGTHVFASVAGGATVTSSTFPLTVPGTVPPGNYRLIVCADDLKKVTEDDETNNCLVAGPPGAPQTVSVMRPNLVVDTVSNPPATAAPGSSFLVSDTTRAAAIGTLEPTVTRYYLSANQTKGSGDKLLAGTHAVPVLVWGDSDGSSVFVTVPSSMAVGLYHLLACADDTKQIAESDEADNCRASTTKVQVGHPDLVVDTLSNPPFAVAPGGSFLVTASTKNQGGIGAPASKTRYYLSLDTVRNSGDRLLGGVHDVGGLAAGAAASEGVTVSVPGTTPIGTYRLLACADDLKAIAETNETNNCKASGATVNVSRPDLVTTYASATGVLTAPPGGVLHVTSTVHNQGIVVADATVVRFWLSLDQVKGAGDKQLVGSQTIFAIPPGGYEQGLSAMTVPASTAPGQYYVVACADAANAVTELNETNNCQVSTSASVTIAP